MTTLEDLARRVEALERAARVNERPYYPPESDVVYGGDTWTPLPKPTYTVTVATPFPMEPAVVTVGRDGQWVQQHAGAGER